MGLFSGFPFQSREDMEKEKQEFLSRVFPLGLEQRDAAQKVLEELLPQKKHHREYLFVFISAKDRYTSSDRSEAVLEKAVNQAGPRKWLTQRDKNIISTLVRMDVDVTSLEEYPTPQQVLQQAGEEA